MARWAVITGAGTGIGAALAKLMAGQGVHVLAVGRRAQPLAQTAAAFPLFIHPLNVDIATDDGIKAIDEAVPGDAKLAYLVQNAAVGVPSKLPNIKREDFEYAFSVNVTAPLMLTQQLLPHLEKSQGRILHLGTGVAFKPQLGTATYGITKLAFHRLYEQLKVDLQGTGVSVASARPGVVDTEGLWDHYKLASDLNLQHTQYFDHVKAEGKMLTGEQSAEFLWFLLDQTSVEEYMAAEWDIHDQSHWPRWKQTQ